jgi:hypothetical protein
MKIIKHSLGGWIRGSLSDIIKAIAQASKILGWGPRLTREDQTYFRIREHDAVQLLEATFTDNAQDLKSLPTNVIPC